MAPVVVQRQVVVFWGPDVQKTVEDPQVQSLDVVVPIVLQRQATCPAVQGTAGGASDSVIAKVIEV